MSKGKQGVRPLYVVADEAAEFEPEPVSAVEQIVSAHTAQPGIPRYGQVGHAEYVRLFNDVTEANRQLRRPLLFSERRLLVNELWRKGYRIPDA